MPLRAGQLDRRITLQRPVPTRDSYGAELVAWQDLATVWAKVEPMGGDEGFRADQPTARQVTRFTIRYRAGVAPAMRVLYGGETYDIDDVSEPERRVSLVLLAHAHEVQSGA